MFRHVNAAALEGLNTDYSKFEMYRNLLVTLCRMPYVSHFNEIRPFFERVFGPSEIDFIYAINHVKETNVSFDTVKEAYIKFVREFYDNTREFVFLIDFLYQTLANVRANNDVNTLTGDLLCDANFMKEILAGRKGIGSFFPKIKYLRGTINIIAAPPGGGKSLYIMHEAIYQTLINNHYTWIFVSGDMDQAAVMSRLYVVVREYEHKYAAYLAKHNIDIQNALKKLKVTVSQYGTISIYDVASSIKNSNVDWVFIDYDDKFVDIDSEEMLYNAAARPYLVMDRHKEGKVIVFASQIKPQSYYQSYNSAIGFLQGSSKKEHIADTITVIRKNYDTNLYSISVLKDRHGLINIGEELHYFEIKDGVITEVELSAVKTKNKKSKNAGILDEPIPF